MFSKTSEWISVVTVHGLPGSGSEVVAKEVARLTAWKYFDEGIHQEMCQRVKHTLGEIASLESSYRSWWTRLLKVSICSWEQYAWHDPGFESIGDRFRYYDYAQDEYLTKSKYVKALKSVVGRQAKEGSVVLHGHGSNLFVPVGTPSLHVLVTVSEHLRVARAEAQQGYSHQQAKKWLKKADSGTIAMFKHLLDSDLMDAGQYDLVLSLDDMSCEEAAQQVIMNIGADRSPAYI